MDNRPSGVMPGMVVSKSAPDGYNLLYNGAAHWLAPFLQRVPYDPVKDFSPITLTVSSPNVLLVNPSLPVKSVKELIALAKARPGELNYGASGTGSSIHLAAESFKAMAGVDIVHINYKGAGAVISDLIAGQVQLAFISSGTAAPHVKSGRLRALAVGSARPSAFFPGLPTVAASGLPGYESASIFGLFARAGTPATLVNRLNREIVTVLDQPSVKERFFNAGIDVVGSSPEELAATVKSQMARLGKVIKDAGIRAE
ncbi:MAG: tripartite tricarboxylate transporter substrate binding protein [Betaproteobacteria bacterium]|nr:tripartite tricarboxylate transporter substrate binding protein [Betaproteobacteria bacterium]